MVPKDHLKCICMGYMHILYVRNLSSFSDLSINRDLKISTPKDIEELLHIGALIH